MQDPASSNHQQHPVEEVNSKQNKTTDQIISRQDYHLTQPCPSEEKQTNKQKTHHKSHPVQSLHKPLDQP